MLTARAPPPGQSVSNAVNNSNDNNPSCPPCFLALDSGTHLLVHANRVHILTPGCAHTSESPDTLACELMNTKADQMYAMPNVLHHVLTQGPSLTFLSPVRPGRDETSTKPKIGCHVLHHVSSVTACERASLFGTFCETRRGLRHNRISIPIPETRSWTQLSCFKHTLIPSSCLFCMVRCPVHCPAMKLIDVHINKIRGCWENAGFHLL